MRTEQIHLEKITWDNYDKICKLRVKKEQDDFVARNERSLVHAYLALSEEKSRLIPLESIWEKADRVCNDRL